MTTFSWQSLEIANSLFSPSNTQVSSRDYSLINSGVLLQIQAIDCVYGLKKKKKKKYLFVFIFNPFVCWWQTFHSHR